MARDYPCHAKDKLAGWPFWLQWRNYPDCPRCERQMRFVFQIDSQDNVPYDFGDSGIVSLFQCPVHKSEVAVREACC